MSEGYEKFFEKMKDYRVESKFFENQESFEIEELYQAFKARFMDEVLELAVYGAESEFLEDLG